MGRHSEGKNGRPEKNSLTDTTLTTLKKILHLPVREEKDRQPRGWGIGDDDETTVWLKQIREERLPHVPYGSHENWEYRVLRCGTVLVGGYYGMQETQAGAEDSVATAILLDWFDWNGVDPERYPNYEIHVRRLGSPEWNGYADGAI